MSWFMAVLVRGSFLDGVLNDEEPGDLLYRLIQAPDAEAAYEKAMQLGQESRDEYQSDDGKTYMLQFLGLADLTEVQAAQLADGVEVYSQLTAGRPSDMVVEKEELTVFEPDSETTSEAFGNEAITPK
jgi:hypothetical protein